MIVFEPRGGLGNRLRSLSSAIHLSLELDRDLYAIWWLDPSLNCRFTDLFTVPGEIAGLRELGCGGLRVAVRRGVHLYYLLFYDVYLDQKRVDSLHGCADALKRFLGGSGGGKAFVQACNRFFGAERPLYKFIPVQSLQSIVDSYEVDNVVGVHIRRTDNRISAAHSPLQGFVELMSREVDLDRGVRFFVSTDEPKVEAEVRMAFPNRIITHTKTSLDRNDPQAIRDAVIDLYCLSNCRKLIGSYWSSFTEVAHLINGIDLVTVDSPDRQRSPNPETDMASAESDTCIAANTEERT